MGILYGFGVIMKKSKAPKKNIEYKRIKDIMELCRSLKVQELVFEGIQIKFAPDTNSCLIPTETKGKPTQIETKLFKDNTNDKDAELDRSVQLCLDPSGFMRDAELGEVSLDQDFGNGTGEEIQ